MTAYLLPLLFTAAAGALTYVFCIRPMRRHGVCHTGPQQQAAAPSATDTAADAGMGAEIQRLREEVDLLRHEADLRQPAAEPFQKREVR
ncbi:hypothetical protein ACWGQ5_28800 [Streptomyces sp. NPDC055722]